MEIINKRTGERINSHLTHSEALSEFGKLYPNGDSWIFFWIHRSVLRAQNQQQAAGGVLSGALTFLADMFLVSIGYQYLATKKSKNPRRPMIRCHFGGRRFKFYLSPKGTICLKTGALALENVYCGCGKCKEGDECEKPEFEYGRDPIGDEVYAGCLNEGKFLLPSGNYFTHQVVRPLLDVEKEFLERLEADPVKFLAQCSRDMGRCCYCNLPLEDPTSKRVGYGKICASRWGLPWGDKKYMEKAPSFAKCYDKDAAVLLQGIRDAKSSYDSWEVFADWLEEHELPRCQRPQADTVLPRG